ncbi:96_t:CDS:2, partial [Gigaspora rosea]
YDFFGLTFSDGVQAFSGFFAGILSFYKLWDKETQKLIILTNTQLRSSFRIHPSSLLSIIRLMDAVIKIKYKNIRTKAITICKASITVTGIRNNKQTSSEAGDAGGAINMSKL